MLGTSPLSATRSASFKRHHSVQQQAGRPAVGSFSRAVAGGSSHASSSLCTAAEAGLTASQLLGHFTFSTSSRRNVSSSPTQSPPEASAGAAPSSSAFAPGGVTVRGFDCSTSTSTSAVAANTSTSVAAAIAAPAAAACPPRPRNRGLLSQALGPDDLLPQQQQQRQEAPLSLGPETIPIYSSGLHRAGSLSWAFPDVDRTLLHDLQERHAVFHSELVSMAYMLAAKAHAGQQRKDGTSQLSHGVMAALQLAELGLDAETVAAGLLHEVLRSHPAFRSQMEEFMPTAVIELVDRVTTISEISHLYRHNKDALGEEKMRRLLLAMEDVKAMLIKLACRCHDMRTLGALPPGTQRALAEETLDIFAVVANRLGVWSLKAELEDLAFAALHPEECEALRAQVSARQNAEALEATIHRIKSALDARGVRYEDISGRPKNLYGIWLKMRANPAITSLDQVYDVTALRVVVANKHDCYVALRCIQEVYRTMPERSKDYIRDQKKPNGYQSLHETIYGEGELPVEVQIRTHKMHFIAEYGFAAHWKYKERLSNEDEWLDKEVQYKKWLTTYKLNLNDNKIRAAGAPTRETALDSLGIKNLCIHDHSHHHNAQPAFTTVAGFAIPTASRSDSNASFTFSVPTPGVYHPQQLQQHQVAAAAQQSVMAAGGQAQLQGGRGLVAGAAAASAVAVAMSAPAGEAQPLITLHPLRALQQQQDQPPLQQQFQQQLQQRRRRAAGAQPGSPTAAAVQAPVQGVVDPFLQHDRFRLEAPQKQRVDFVLQTQDGVELRQLPVGFPAARLAQELRLDRLPGYQLLVNKRLPAQGQHVRSGDLVQVVPRSGSLLFSAPAGPRHSSSSVQDADGSDNNSPASPQLLSSSAPSGASASLLARAALANRLSRREVEALAAAQAARPLSSASGSGSSAVPAPLQLRVRRMSTGAGVAVAAAASATVGPTAAVGAQPQSPVMTTAMPASVVVAASRAPSLVCA